LELVPTCFLFNQTKTVWFKKRFQYKLFIKNCIIITRLRIGDIQFTMTTNPRHDVIWKEKIIVPTSDFEYEILFQYLATNPRMEVYFDLMAMLKSVYYVIQRNYFDLTEFQKRINTSQNQIELLSDHQQRGKTHTDISLECTRFLHNLLASFVAFIDISRNIFIRSDIFSPNFQNVYQCEVDRRFKENFEGLFIKKLRQYMLHNKLAYIIPKIIITEISNSILNSSIQVNLERSELLKWDGWNRKERNKIEMNSSEEFDVLSIIQIHFENVTDFCEWLSKTVDEDFENDINMLNTNLQYVRTHK
jgi:hypothetical protein